MHVTTYVSLNPKKLIFQREFKSFCPIVWIVLFMLLLLSSCYEKDRVNHNADSQMLQPTATVQKEEAGQGNTKAGVAVPLNNIIHIPSDITKDFSDEQALKPDYQMAEEIVHNTSVHDVRYRAPYLIYSHFNGENDAITIYDVNERTKCEFPSRTSLRRFIRFASFSDTGYGYLNTAEHEPYTWQYFRFDSLHHATVTKPFDIRKVILKENNSNPVYQSDVEEEGNLFAWIEETKGSVADSVADSVASERFLYICLYNADTPELIHTIRLNQGVNTLTPLTIKNQCISYVDYHPQSKKWYIRTYDVFKGDPSPDTCDFELEVKPESPPLFDRSALAWVEEREGVQTLYSYNIQKNEKYRIDTDIRNPNLEYPALFYVKNDKLFCFDLQENTKRILFQSEQGKVDSGGGNAQLPFCLTKEEKGSNLLLLHAVPPSMQDIQGMKWITNKDGILELQRESPFIRTGMENCTVVYNGLDRPGLFVQDMGWPLTGVCDVIRADIQISRSTNVLGADVPEEFTVSHGNKCLTFTGEAVPNALGDGGASYKCHEVPGLQAVYVKRNIVTDLPDLLDALEISWSVDSSDNTFIIEDDMPYTQAKPIIEIKDEDLNGDGIKEPAGLFLADNRDVILKVNEQDVSVFCISHEDQIFGNIPYDHYECNLYLEGNKILAGITFSGTNKYGSTSWLYCYQYESGRIEKIWSSEERIHERILIEEFNEECNRMKVKIGNEQKEIFLGDSLKSEVTNFINYLIEIGEKDMEMEFIITPDYEYRDYDGDGRQEIITRTVVHFGATSFQRDCYSIYKFSKEGIQLVDSYFQ